MEKITSQDMFERFCAAGRGYIYNDFSGQGASGAKYNVLHMATCRTLQ